MTKSHTFEIQPFSAAQSMKFFLSRLGRHCSDDEEYHATCEILEGMGGLPLAITTFAKYLSQTCFSIPQLRSLLRKQSSESCPRQHRNTSQYVQNLGEVWDASFMNIPQESLPILDFIAFLDPDSIQEEMVAAGHTKPLSNLPSETSRYDMITISTLTHS